MRIVILTNTPYSRRDEKRFGILYFHQKKIDITVLDITKYINKNYDININDKSVNTSIVFYFDSLKKIKMFFFKNRDSIVISYIGDKTFQAYRLYHFLYSNNIIFGRIIFGSIPFSSNSLENWIKRISLQKIYRTIKYLFARVIYKNFFYSFLHISCMNNLKNLGIHFDKNSTNIIRGHTLDYDLYLEIDHPKRIFDFEYAVFIDQYIPFHPDAKLRGENYKHITNDYYNKLNTLFNKIEKQTGLKIIIAAHPISRKEDNDKYWKERDCINGETMSLIRYSKLCITHYSTAINFAILYNKPILFVYMNYAFGKYVKTLAKVLSNTNDNIINVDYPNLNNLFAIDQKKYDAYKSEYIQLSSEEKNNWELFINDKFISEKLHERR